LAKQRIVNQKPKKRRVEMKRIFVMISVILIGLFSFAHAETTVLDPGEGILSAAIELAQSGDVLVLNAGEYTESNLSEVNALGMPIDKKLTIQAAEDAAERPVIRNLSAPSGHPTKGVFFLMKDGANLTVRGLEFNGGDKDTTLFRSAYHVFTLDTDDGAIIEAIKMYDCYLHDVSDRIVEGDAEKYEGIFVTNDTLICENSLISGCWDVFDYRRITVKFFKLVNTTLWDLVKGGKGRILRTGFPVDSLYVDHCTFGDNDHRYFQMKPDLGGFGGHMFKNSIFANSGKDAIQVQDEPFTTVTHCLFWNIGGDPTSLHEEAVVTDTLTADPMFADPEEGDFTLAEGSPAIGAADDGSALGDPRWDPTTTAVEQDIAKTISEYQLQQNYPNPFNPVTTISFNLAASDMTTLLIYNTLGQAVRTVVDEHLNAGLHSVQFNASDLPSGIYIYHLQSGEFSTSKKMMLLK
jgi:hypothetical protein